MLDGFSQFFPGDFAAKVFPEIAGFLIVDKLLLAEVKNHWNFVPKNIYGVFEGVVVADGGGGGAVELLGDRNGEAAAGGHPEVEDGASGG